MNIFSANGSSSPHNRIKQCRALMVCALLFPALITDTNARTWKDTKGRVIEADFVSSAGDEVTIRRAGKEITFPLSLLSIEDRDWVAAQEKADADTAVATGLIKNHPVTILYRQDPKDWADGRVAKKCSKWEKLGIPHNPKCPTGFEDCVTQKNQSCLVYVPASYDGSEPYGIYLHIHSGDTGLIPRGYREILDKRKLILVSPHLAGNDHAYWERVSRAMNSLATVRAQWNIDPDRVYSAGASGGGHMAFLTHAIYSTEFRGAISHAAQSYPPNYNNVGGHFGGMEQSDFRRGRRSQNRWLVIMGMKDARNLPESRLTAPFWEKMPVTYRCDEIAGMGHSCATPKDFEVALEWLESNPENSKRAKSKD